MMYGNSGCVTSKAQSKQSMLPPIADSVVRRGRINYGDNSYIITNLDYLIVPMILIASIEAGVFCV